VSAGFYLPANGGFEPLEAAQSPWNARLQSGVAMAGLIAHAIEQTPAAAEMMLTRLTVDILRAAPMTITQATCALTRDGRNLQTLDVALSVGGQPVARATALRVRLAASPPHFAAGAHPPPDAAAEAKPVNRRHVAGTETRLLYGGLTKRGPGAAWVRPRVDLVAGLPTSPLVAAAMAADYGSAVSCILDSRDWSFANVDIAVHFVRPPVSTWIRAESRTIGDGAGSALVDTTLADLEGDFGYAHQTLFVAPAAAPLEGGR
jgi:acyl-coenzyme A thioesterase PaaI-like protein